MQKVNLIQSIKPKPLTKRSSTVERATYSHGKEIQYDVFTHVKISKVLIDMPDGKVMVTHRSVRIYFKHKRTGDCLEFRITKKGNHFILPNHLSEKDKKEKLIRQVECLDEFKRLTDDANGQLIYTTAVLRRDLA